MKFEQSWSRINRIINQYVRSLNVPPTQFQQQIVMYKIVVCLNHAIIFSRMEMDDKTNRFLTKTELLATHYPKIVANKSGILICYISIKRLDLAFQMLQKACEIADSDNAPEELYGEIYSYMCTYVEIVSEKV